MNIKKTNGRPLIVLRKNSWPKGYFETWEVSCQLDEFQVFAMHMGGYKRLIASGKNLTQIVKQLKTEWEIRSIYI